MEERLVFVVRSLFTYTKIRIVRVLVSLAQARERATIVPSGCQSACQGGGSRNGTDLDPTGKTLGRFGIRVVNS